MIPKTATKTSAFCTALSLLCAAAMAQTTTLLPLNSTEGVTLTWGQSLASRDLQVVTEPEQTTDKDGALHLRARTNVTRGNHYVGISVPFPHQVDLTEYSILVDVRTNLPEDTKAFYVRIYNVGENQPAWSFNSWSGLIDRQWRTFQFQPGLCPQGLAWEPGMVENRTATKANRIEFIIGSNNDHVDIDALIDNVRLAPTIGTMKDLTSVKARVPNTVLVDDGQPAATVLHPDSEAGRLAAAQVVDAVREQTGVTLTARPGTEADRIPERTAIVLGNVSSNPAMLLLYARKFTPADQVCPGAGGSLVHTVFDPFGKRSNVIVLAASDAAGLTHAAAVLCAQIAQQPRGADLVLPRLFEKNYSDDFLKVFPWADDEPATDRLEKGLQAGRNALDTGRHTSVAGILASVAQRYLLTGHSVEAKLYVQLWDMYVESAVADPRKFGGPWGFDSDFPSANVVPGWDIIEEDPELTDEERLRTTKALARWLSEAVVSSCSGAARSTRVPHNHETFPALGTMFAGLYFTQHYDVIEGEVWLEIADSVFSRQAGYFKPYEDCNGYQWLTNGHLFWYALARPDFSVFENGNGAKIIDYCIGNMDNLGYQVPYGDTGSWQCWNSEMICLDIFAFATGNTDALWAANHKRTIKRQKPQIMQFFQMQEGGTPNRFNGVQVWPLEPAYYDTWRHDQAPPLERTFDKITFREAMDPQAPYLLLDGLSNGGHKHEDGNSIPRITQFGRIWLADNDYFKAPLKYHNSLVVLRNGESATIPPYCEFLGAGESEQAGYSRTRINDYAGTDWERTIVWLKPRQAFAVLDRLTAKEAGDFQFRLLWHGVGSPELSERGMRLTQSGASMWVQVAPGPELTLTDDPDLGKNWAGYPHADPLVRSMTGTATVHLEQGETYLFATLFHGSPDQTAEPLDLDFLAGMDAVRLGAAQEATGIALGPVNTQLAEGQFVTDADLVVAHSAGLSLLNATTAEVGADVLHTSATLACVDLAVDSGNALASVPRARPVANATPGGDATAHAQLWNMRPSAELAVLSGNANTGGALPGFCTITSDPQPAEANALSPESQNRVQALVDGSWDTVATSVMYDPDQTVQLTFTLKAPCQLQEISWHQWWATTSSRRTAYLLENAQVSISNDGFVNDERQLATITDPGPHPDWGQPIAYVVDAKSLTASAVRLTITPRKGTAVYLGEVLIKGTPQDNEDFPASPYTFTKLTSARTAPDGRRIILAATAEGDLLALESDGTTLWKQAIGSKINDLYAVDIDGDGIDEIALARHDFNVSLLSSDGEELWSRALSYYRSSPHVNVVRAGDIDGDGTPEIICGGQNWRFYAFDAKGKELWNYESVHPSRSGAVADLDGDGKAEVICGTHYYSLSVLNDDGTRRWHAGFGPICWDVATGSFDANQTRGVVCGSGNGSVYVFAHDGKKRMQFNTGDEVRNVAAADLDGDGIDEILAVSLSTNAYCFNADGTRRWHVPLGAPATHLVTVPTATGALAVVGTADGHVVTLDQDGTLVALDHLDSPINAFTALEDSVIVATENGRLRRLRTTP